MTLHQILALDRAAIDVTARDGGQSSIAGRLVAAARMSDRLKGLDA